MGVVHQHDDGGSYHPITIMPEGGAFDRVRSRAEDLFPSYFQVPGTWGDDSKYLVGFCTALLVFEPYGFWTNIEIANGLVQNKPVVIIADPNELKAGGKYHERFLRAEKYIEQKIDLPGEAAGVCRIYKDASDAAEWINECYKQSVEKANV